MVTRELTIRSPLKNCLGDTETCLRSWRHVSATGCWGETSGFELQREATDLVAKNIEREMPWKNRLEDDRPVVSGGRDLVAARVIGRRGDRDRVRSGDRERPAGVRFPDPDRFIAERYDEIVIDERTTFDLRARVPSECGHVGAIG